MSKSVFAGASKIYFFNIILFIITLSFNSGYSQTEKNNDNRWNIFLNNGLTFHLSDQIYRRDYNYTVNYLELGLSYFVNKNNEIGISFGKNDFVYSKTIYSNPDSSGLRTDAQLLRNYHWASINYTFNFEDRWFLGGKIGAMESSEGNQETLIGIFFGKKIFEVQNFYSKIIFSYNARTTLKFEQLYSNQFSLILGLGFRF